MNRRYIYRHQQTRGKSCALPLQNDISRASSGGYLCHLGYHSGYHVAVDCGSDISDNNRTVGIIMN
jgi:hypothetical protein